MNKILGARTIALVDFDSACYIAGCADTLQECKDKVDGMLDSIQLATSCELEVWIEGGKYKNIFRNHVAVTRPYKGTRQGKEAPPFLKEAKEYVLSKATEGLNVHLATNMEAEDAVLTRANEIGIDNVVISCIDKDLHQQHGRFYNYRTEETFDITEEEAHYNLYKQILTGDSVDNIPGLQGVGPKKAEAILEDDYPLEVAMAYAERGMPYQYLLEQSRLIYLLREWKDVFMFPVSEEEYNQLLNDGEPA